MGENSLSDDQVEQICIMNDDKINGFQVLEKIDEGAYGQVFKVSKNGKKYAMKVEPNRFDGQAPAVQREIDILMELNKNGARYFPKMIVGKQEPKFYMCVMTLLGESLKRLRMKCKDPNSCTSGTWSRIGIQCLFVVKQMHDAGLVHHDIKPSNFVMGHPDEMPTNRVLHLIDFGISRKFVRSMKGAPVVNNLSPASDLAFRVMRKPTRLVGTPMYTSPNAHELVDISRIDDCWSLMYMIAELVKPLPWELLEGKELEKVKLKTKLKDLYGNDVFDSVEEMLQNSGFYSFPNYELIYKAFRSVYNKSRVSWLDPYDWETSQLPSYIRWKQVALKRFTLFPWEYYETNRYYLMDPFHSLQNSRNHVDQRMKKKKKKKKRRSASADTLDDTMPTTTETTCEEIAPPTPQKKIVKGELKKPGLK